MKWPEELPWCANQKGFRGESGGGAIRLDMDFGPAYQRPRGRVVVERFDLQFSFDMEQYKRFREFWYNELLNGTQPFDWQHPETHDPARVQFDVNEGFNREANGPEMQVSLVLEVLPQTPEDD